MRLNHVTYTQLINCLNDNIDLMREILDFLRDRFSINDVSLEVIGLLTYFVSEERRRYNGTTKEE